MIFVTAGTQKFHFNRLMHAIDQLAIHYPNEQFVVQYPMTYSFTRENVSLYANLNDDEFQKRLNEADIVITHSGTGTLIKCEKNYKKYIIVPRLSQFDEHIDDHQLEISEVFSQHGNAILINDIKDLKPEFDKLIVNDYGWQEMIIENKAILDSIETVVNLYLEK